MAEDVHELILRTYDIGLARLSADDLMSEVAEYFSTRAAALIVCKPNPGPSLLCYGENRTGNACASFSQSLQGDLTMGSVNRLIEANFSADLNGPDRGRYTLLFDTAGSNAHNDESQEELAFVLMPHIVRSIHLFSTTGELTRQSREAVEQLSEQLVPATITLDRDGFIVSINAKAGELLRSTDSIHRIHDRIDLQNPAHAQRMRSELSSLLDGSTDEPRFMRIGGYGHESDLFLLMKQREGQGQGAVIYLHSMSNSRGSVPVHIAEKFKLTQKESRLVAGLMQGRILRQLAAEFHVSTHTLRAQMKSVFRKTGVNSQAALIVLMLDCHSVVFGLQEASTEPM